MNIRAVVNEFGKMRHLRAGAVAGVLVSAVVGLSVFSAVTNPEFADPAKRSWESLLAGISLAVALASPVLLAILASRQVDIEHQSNGWLLSRTAGLTAGGLCRTKLVAIGIVVAVATTVQSTLVLGAGFVLGITEVAPIGRWFGYTAAILVANLVVLALHILLAARIDNQLIGLGVGALGSMVAVFASALPPWLAHLFPWGYYSLVAAADYRDGALLPLTPSYPSVVALGVVGGALFLLGTGRLDRQEV